MNPAYLLEAGSIGRNTRPGYSLQVTVTTGAMISSLDHSRKRGHAHQARGRVLDDSGGNARMKGEINMLSPSNVTARRLSLARP